MRDRNTVGVMVVDPELMDSSATTSSPLIHSHLHLASLATLVTSPVVDRHSLRPSSVVLRYTIIDTSDHSRSLDLACQQLITTATTSQVMETTAARPATHDVEMITAGGFTREINTTTQDTAATVAAVFPATLVA